MFWTILELKGSKFNKYEQNISPHQKTQVFKIEHANGGPI